MDKPSENSGFLNDKFSGQEATPSAGLWDGIAAETGTGPLASAFGAYESTPSASVWDGVAATLHPKRRRAMIWWWSSAASVLLLLGVTSFFLMNHTVSSNHFVLNQPEVNPIEDRVPVAFENEEAASPNAIITNDKTDNDRVNQQSPQEDPRIKKSTDRRQNNSLALQESKAPQAPSSDGNEKRKEQTGTSELERLAFLNALPATVEQDIPEGQLIYFPSIPPPPGGETESENLFALAGSFSPFVNQPSAQTSESILNTFSTSGLTENNGFDEADTPVLNPLDESLGNVDSETQYSPPLTFGIQFIAINHKRISLGTGVEVTTLGGKSESTFGSFSTEQQFSQQYIGVPLFAQVDWFQREKFSLYIKTGGVFDIGWRSQTQIDDFEDDNLTNSYTYSFRPGNQARMINSLGFRSSLTNSLSLFIEGNGSILLYQANSNLWSGRKFWPSMGVGVIVGF